MNRTPETQRPLVRLCHPTNGQRLGCQQRFACRRLISILFCIVLTLPIPAACPAAPADPNGTAASLRNLTAIVKEAIERYCKKWSAAQRAQYLESVAEGLRAALTRPATQDEVRAFASSFARLVKGYENYAPGQSDVFADASLVFRLMCVNVSYRCRCFAARVSDPKSKDRRARLEAQWPEIVKLVRQVCRRQFPNLPAEQIDEAVQRLGAQWRHWADDALTPGLKKPLTAEQMRELPRRAKAAVSNTRRMAERMAQCDPKFLKGDSVDKRALAMSGAAITSVLLSMTAPPESPESKRLLAKIAEQHRTRSKQWMEEQKQKFMHDFVATLVAPAVESNDRVLLLIEPAFAFGHILGDDVCGFWY